MTTATYTLQNDGLAVKNIAEETILSEWWSRSPVSIPGVGDGYEAIATLISNVNGNLTGIFNEWTRIDRNLSWSAESEGESLTVISIRIREPGTNEVLAQCNVTLQNILTVFNGWNPAFQTDNSGGVGQATYSDATRIFTIDNFGGSTRMYFGGFNARSNGQRYIEYRVLVGDPALPQFDPIETQLLEADLMPTTLEVDDNNDGVKVIGVRFESDTQIPNDGEYVRVYENDQTLTASTKTGFGTTGDVIAFAIDFDALTWDVYLNNVLIGNFPDFGLGKNWGLLQPAMSLPAPILWSIRIQEEAATQSFTPPLGYIPWVDSAPDWGGAFPIERATITSPTPGINNDFADDFGFAKNSKDRLISGQQLFDNAFNNVGRAYFYFYNGLSWSIEQIVESPVQANNQFFGFRFAMNSDGSRAIITKNSNGTPAQANVYVYARSGTTWTQIQIIETNYAIGTTSQCADLSDDGDVLILSVNGSRGEINVFRWNGSSYVFEQSLTGAGGNSFFAISASISGDGSVIAATQNLPDRIYVFQDDGGSWSEREEISVSDIGNVKQKAIDLNVDGTIFAYNRSSSIAPNVFAYKWNGANYIQFSSRGLGAIGATQLSSDGTTIVNMDTSQTRAIVATGDTDSEYDFINSLVPIPQDGVTGNADSLMISNDNNFIVLGDSGWTTANGQEGRIASWEINP